MPLDNELYAAPVPDAVRRAAARADEIQRQVYEPEPQAEPEVPVAEAPEATTTVVETPPAVDWEQRYRTLQGKYDAEVPALRGNLHRMTGQLEQMQASLEELRTTRAAPPAPTVPDEDKETYGEDLVAAARRWARAEVASELADLKSQMGDLAQTTKSVQQESAQDRAMRAQNALLAQLDADPSIGKTWRVTNDAPEFMAWLDLADPFTGTQRMALLRDAYSRGDAVRTAAFFKAYHSEQTALRSPSVPPSTPHIETDRPSLGDFAAPGRRTGPATGSGAPEDKRLWTQREIKAFYHDKNHGKFNGRDAEALRLELDIIAATSEGRIRS